jgi:hypothetical protein
LFFHVQERSLSLGMKLADVPARWRVTAICLRCSHAAALPVAYLVATRQVGPLTTLGDLENRNMLRCARCDSRKAKLDIETDGDPAAPQRARRRIVDGETVVIAMPKRRVAR